MATLEMGRAINQTKRVTTAVNGDQIVEEYAVASYDAGLVIWPKIVVPDPTVTMAMAAQFETIRPGVEVALRQLADPSLGLTNRAAIIRVMAEALHQVALQIPSDGIAYVPVRDLQVNAKGGTFESGREAIATQLAASGDIGPMFAATGVRITDFFASIQSARGMVAFRTPVTAFNPQVRKAAISALRACLGAWNDAKPKPFHDVWDLRLEKLLRKVGIEELAKLLANETVEFLHAGQLFEYYARMFIVTDDFWQSLAPLLTSALSSELLDAVLVMKMNHQLAINALYELLPYLRKALTSPVIFKMGEVDLQQLEATHHLLEGMELLRPLLERPMTKEPLGSLLWTGSSLGYWKAVFKPRPFRVYYMLGKSLDKSGMLDPWWEKGLVGAQEVALRALKANPAMTTAKDLRPQDYKALLEAFIRKISFLRVNGDRLEAIIPLGVVADPEPWNAVWTTASPAEAARSMDIPIWELFPSIPDSENGPRNWENLYRNSQRAVKLLTSQRFVRTYSLDAPFEAFGSVLPLEQQSISPVTMAEIRGEACITPRDLSAMVGKPIIPRSWAGTFSYGIQASIPQHAMGWQIS
jgi:hypothetical protein